MDQRPQHARANANPVCVGDGVATFSDSNVDLVSPGSLLQTGTSATTPRETHVPSPAPRDNLESNDSRAHVLLPNSPIASDVDNDQGSAANAVSNEMPSRANGQEEIVSVHVVCTHHMVTRSGE
ncbi:hypothetical protein V6N13_042689 [Hibiscus sabdariffa]